jgi:hypothetical protein
LPDQGGALQYHEAGASGVQSALDSVRLVPEKVADTRAA